MQITPRVCFSRPPTEAPRTDAFAEVDEVEADKTLKRIFSGWMFADSPGLHGIEHPVYDIWLTECKGDGPLIKEAPEVVEAPPDDRRRRRKPAGGKAGRQADARRQRRSRPGPSVRAASRQSRSSRRLTSASARRSRTFFPDDAAPGAPMRIGR